MTIRLLKLNESILRVSTPDDEGILEELAEHFSFYAEGYKFHPLFKTRQWDGKIRIFSCKKRTLPLGLLAMLNTFALERKYKIEYENEFFPDAIYPKRTREGISNFVASIPLSTRGIKIEPKDYQLEAVVHSLLSTRAVCISPTGSGKSLIIYLLIRWFLEHGALNSREKVLLIVPTVGLVSQMHKDILDYSTGDTSFAGSNEVHQIYAGKEKLIINGRIVVTTWQSAIAIKSREWFAQYGMVISDEAHLAAGKSITTILELLTNARYRIGLTGTLDGSKAHEYVIQGSLGPIHKVISTRELMDKDVLAPLKINIIKLKYPQEDRLLAKGLKYDEEIKFLVSHTARNTFISRLAISQTCNTLVMFNLVTKHGIPLYEQIKSMAGPGRNVYYVAGSVDVDDRERIRQIVEKENNAIIVGSSGTFSTGVNIRKLSAIIFGAPWKSQIKVLQSIGRGLRKTDDNATTVLYDIVDDFKLREKSPDNYSLAHGIHRISIYEKEQFDMSIHEYTIKGSAK